MAVPVWLPHGFLSALVLAPMAFALCVLALDAAASRVLGRDRVPRALWRGFGLAVTSLQGVVGAACLWTGFDAETLGLQLVERFEWLPQYGHHLHFGIDGLSLFPVLLVLFIVPTGCWATARRSEHVTAGAVARVLFVQSAALGVLLSVNVMQLHFFWTLLLLPTFFAIVGWGGPEPVRAALSWLMPGVLGSMGMLFVLIVVHRLGYEQLHVWVLDLVASAVGGEPGLLDVAVPVTGPLWATQPVLFGVLAVSIAVRLRVFPFHVWSARATAHAPPEGLVLLDVLQGVLGIWILVRVGLPLLPQGAAAVAPFGSVLAVIGLLYGALTAGAQSDLRRLQGQAHTASMGLVLLGVFTLGEHGVVGALVSGWSVALASTAMLVLVGLLADRRGTSELAAFGGLSKPMPVFSLLFVIALFAFSGTPGTLGFVGELLALAGAFAHSPGLALAALLGVLVAGACLLRGYRAVALGPVTQPENRGLIDLDWRERLAVLLLLVPLLGFGLHPNPMLRRVEPAVLDVLHVMDLRSGAAPDGSDPTGAGSPDATGPLREER